jgi:hypothetical protein
MDKRIGLEDHDIFAVSNIVLFTDIFAVH